MAVHMNLFRGKILYKPRAKFQLASTKYNEGDEIKNKTPKIFNV